MMPGESHVTENLHPLTDEERATYEWQMWVDGFGETESQGQPNHRSFAAQGVDEFGEAVDLRQRNHRYLAAQGVDEFEGAAPRRQSHLRRSEGNAQEGPAGLQNLLLTRMTD